MSYDRTKKKKQKEEKKPLSVTTIINIVIVLLFLGVIAYAIISAQMETKSIQGHKTAANQAIKTIQEALDKRDTYNAFTKGWGNFQGADFCNNPPNGMDIEMLAYGGADVNASRSLASYLICSPDKGISPGVIPATAGCSNTTFQTKDGMVFYHMGSTATKWDRAIYVDTNGSFGPTISLTPLLKRKDCSLTGGGYGDLLTMPNAAENTHETCAPNDSINDYPDMICLIISGGKTVVPGDERTKKILATGKPTNLKNVKKKSKK